MADHAQPTPFNLILAPGPAYYTQGGLGRTDVGRPGRRPSPSEAGGNPILPSTSEARAGFQRCNGRHGGARLTMTDIGGYLAVSPGAGPATPGRRASGAIITLRGNA
jgi:hypothetical protein